MSAEVLEQAGIAWPSYEMFHHAVPRSSPQMPTETFIHGPHMVHKKMPSMGSLNLPGMGGPQPLASPMNPYQNINNFDAGSRSTSAYSTVSASAGPILNGYQMAASPQQQAAPADPTRDSMPYSFRLPSDQLAQIIQALNPRKYEQQTQQVSDSMPPPPLPGQATHLKNGNENVPIGHVAPLAPKMQRSEMDQHAINAIDRRAASNSNYSDISMHAGCSSFPQCITEDPNGCLVHHNTAAPAAVVKGKKEGASSPTKRKLSSTAAKKSDRTEKRTRNNSTRLLQRGAGDAGTAGRRTSNRSAGSASSAAADVDDDGAEGHDDEPGEGEGRVVVRAGVE